MMNDGSLLAMQTRAVGTGDCAAIEGGCVQFAVDINGPMKGPNSSGKDLFDWIMLYKNHELSYIPNYPSRASWLSSCKNNNGQNCAQLIIYDGWQIKSDYPW